jgi:hypothetical protein
MQLLFDQLTNHDSGAPAHAEREYEQETLAHKEDLDVSTRAFSACMDDRRYSVK